MSEQSFVPTRKMGQIAMSAYVAHAENSKMFGTDTCWQAAADAVIEECIANLDGEIKSCTLGWDLADKISEADACKLLNAQRLVDIATLRRLQGGRS